MLRALVPYPSEQVREETRNAQSPMVVKSFEQLIARGQYWLVSSRRV